MMVFENDDFFSVERDERESVRTSEQKKSRVLHPKVLMATIITKSHSVFKME